MSNLINTISTNLINGIDFFLKTEKSPGTIGIPRALLYYRDGILWKNFFENLGFKCVTSRKSDRELLDDGVAAAVDETCLSLKMYFGHVIDLADKCDVIFVPRTGGYEKRERMCTRFESLPDLVCATFKNRGIRVLTLSFDWNDKTDEKEVFVKFGQELGKSKKQSKKAYKAAKKCQDDFLKKRTKRQHSLIENGSGTKILLAGHPYVLHDPYIGGELEKTLSSLGADVLFSDYEDRLDCLKSSYRFSGTLPWIINREIVGACMNLMDKIDGIVILSAYPCGPDSLVDEMMTKTFTNVPVLTLTLDVQSGMAGIQTRLESFLDIIKYKKAGGYAADKG